MAVKIDEFEHVTSRTRVRERDPHRSLEACVSPPGRGIEKITSCDEYHAAGPARKRLEKLRLMPLSASGIELRRGAGA